RPHSANESRAPGQNHKRDYRDRQRRCGCRIKISGLVAAKLRTIKQQSGKRTKRLPAKQRGKRKDLWHKTLEESCRSPVPRWTCSSVKDISHLFMRHCT